MTCRGAINPTKGQATISAADYRAAVLPKGKRHKYGAVKAYRCGDCGGAVLMPDRPCCSCLSANILTFDSSNEALRWDELRQHQSLGLITGLRRQVRYSIDINGVHIGDYIADHVYLDETGKQRVEDFKGVDTDLSAFKRKCVAAQYGITVEVVR